MSWSRKLATPIMLNDGRRLKTLRDAAAVVVALPDRRQLSDVWQRTVPALVAAASSEGDLKMAQAKLSDALRAEGLL
jgi:hypothetical protein